MKDALPFPIDHRIASPLTSIHKRLLSILSGGRLVWYGKENNFLLPVPPIASA